MSAINSIGGNSGGNTGASSNAALAALQASATSSTSAQAAKENSAAEQQNRFLTLLVAQMKNQDPLNPVDNAEVTSQLAQISTVDGIERLNGSMKTMAGSIDGAQAVQGATLAGRQVLVTGNSMEMAKGKGVGGFQLDQAVDQLNITITDAAGTVVNHVALGAQTAGVHAFEWDGMTDAGQAAVDGSYTYKMEALVQGKSIDITSLAFGRVDGVSKGSDGLALNVGRLGVRTLDQVKQIMQ
jgi:flagellar basal-body rod modification protein FlgD